MRNIDILMSEISESAIDSYLGEEVLSRVQKLYIFDALPSTNAFLLEKGREKAGAGSGALVACLANQQTAGRGRNGRHWQSPENSNIYLSVGYQFENLDHADLSCLSAACGVAICEWLDQLGVQAGLKWPNDVLVQNRKLAGILVEVKVSSSGIYVVIGIGLNVDMPAEAATLIDQPWIDLRLALSPQDEVLERNRLVAGLLTTLTNVCKSYEESGFAGFVKGWDKYDLLTGKTVRVESGESLNEAKVLGVNKDCSLSVLMNGGETTVYSADIKIKLESEAGNS